MAAASETSFEMQPGDSAPGETAASEGVVAEQASSGSSGGDAESNPPSPGRLIPAIKPELQRTSFQLHAWTVQLGYTTTLDGGSETAEAAPAWRRTWQWWVLRGLRTFLGSAAVLCCTHSDKCLTCSHTAGWQVLCQQ